MKKSYLTVTDQFCGAGGSSIGATSAGAELRLALNHWQLAIETHNSNFPNAAHDCTDSSCACHSAGAYGLMPVRDADGVRYVEVARLEVTE